MKWVRTWCTPTKLMDGQGRVLGGITVGDPELIQNLSVFRLTEPFVSV
jgi:O-succinylhomoserine sulfhydrylase